MLTSEVLFAVAAIVVLYSVVTSLWLNPFRKIKLQEAERDMAEDVAALPKLTVLIDAIDNTEGLEQHLPAILTQDYPADFEVVVVTERDNPAAEAIVKHYQKDERLRSTFIPQDTLFLSRHKLAVTLGVKAAANDWIILVDSDCAPLSDEWLKTMAQEFAEGKRLVLGYVNYDTETSPVRRYLCFRRSLSALRRASKSSAFCSCGANVAFRRSNFLTQQPYRGNLSLEYGEYDFLVNGLSTGSNTSVCISEDGHMAKDKPSTEQWKHSLMVGYNVRRQLRHYVWESLKQNIGRVLTWLNAMLIAATLAAGLLLQNWILLGAALFAWIITLTLRLVVVRKTIRQFGESISMWKSVLLYEPLLPLHDLSNRMSYLRMNKEKFNTHKP